MKKLFALTLVCLMLLSCAAAELQITLDEFLNIYNWHPLNQTGTIGTGSLTKSQAFSGYDDYTCYASPKEATIMDFGVAPDGSLVHATAMIPDIYGEFPKESLDELLLVTLALFGAATPRMSDEEVYGLFDTLNTQLYEKVSKAPDDNFWLSEIAGEGLVYQFCLIVNEESMQSFFRVNFRSNSFGGV